MIDRTNARTTRNRCLQTSTACWLVLLAGPASLFAADRIRLDPDMLINLSGQRPAIELVDEQDLPGDPRTGNASQLKTPYSNGWINAKLYYPLSVVIDLGSVHDLTDICLFDMEDHAQLSVDFRETDAWKPLFVDELNDYRKWSSHKAAVSTRYLRLTFESPSALIGEILLYGTARGHQPKRSWYYVATLRHVLRGTRFDSKIPSTNANVRIYRFRSENRPTREVYAVWCPTSNSTAVGSFSLSLPNATTATVTTLDPQSATGRSSSLTTEAGKATLAVSESPVFVTAPGF